MTEVHNATERAVDIDAQTNPEADGTVRAGPETEGSTRVDTTEYERLRTKKHEREGTIIGATVGDVHVGESVVTLSLSFPWKVVATERVHYDLDDDRDLLELETLCETHGFSLEQVSHLEGATVEVTYTGSEWVPTAHLDIVEGEGSLWGTFTSELHLLARSLARSPGLLRRGVVRLRSLSTQETIIAVILLKKLAIAVVLAAVLL